MSPAETARIPEPESRVGRFPLATDEGRGAAHAERVLCGVFFLSGAAALVFETLWFRRAGLAFGNGVWASALVLSSFMGGLALGNLLAARIGHRVAKPERLYAKLELAVAAFGFALVAGFPFFTSALTPLWRSLSDAPLALNALRLTTSFLFLLIPATAMGMTLPLLVKALARSGGGFGRALGRLYGWNTLGAVAGALVAEIALVEAFGILGAGLCAVLFNVLAAYGAVRVARPVREAEAEESASRTSLSPTVKRALAASFLAGGTLLALEVVWFRFLQLFAPGTTLTFAVMLAVVLAGIGLGGLAASRWFRRDASAYRRAGTVALAGGVVAVLGYTGFDLALGGQLDTKVRGFGLDVLVPCLFLTFPLSLLSGVLFSLVGGRVQAELKGATRSAGLVTLANTLGATLGPLVAGFWLIPRLGMETSFFALALVYAAIALLLGRPRGRIELGLAAALILAAILFPFGRMERYLGVAREAWMRPDTQVVASREGTVETIQYLRRDYLGEPSSYRLVTNGYSMASTDTPWRRYMKAYVWWPVAVHPGPKSACLISFGTGSTAQALTDTASLESITVVDISREILEMADVIYSEPGTNPLDDPRVETRVEDGRFFLQTTDRTFDLITSEPPPPKMAGVVNLYTEEYFQLIHDRLAEGGIATYWLPVVQFSREEALAVTRAFLNAFGEETTLWTGSGFEWMLVGTKGAAPVDREHFEAQWRDPTLAPEMATLGFEHPEQLGATFLGDAVFLEALTEGVEPLSDDHPKRLGSRLAADAESVAYYQELMQPEQAFKRFLASNYVRRIWPPELIANAEPSFVAQDSINRVTLTWIYKGNLDLARLHWVLTQSDLRFPVLLAFGMDAKRERILLEHAPSGESDDPDVVYKLGVSALANRDFERAFAFLEEANRMAPRDGLLPLRLYLRCLTDRREDAQRLFAANEGWFATRRELVGWFEGTLGFEPRM